MADTTMAKKQALQRLSSGGFRPSDHPEKYREWEQGTRSGTIKEDWGTWIRKQVRPSPEDPGGIKQKRGGGNPYQKYGKYAGEKYKPHAYGY